MAFVPRLVILGTGFAGVSLLRRITPSLYDVTVVSPRNHFLFTPLLPSTTVGTVEFRSIIEPVRTMRRDITFIQATATALDTERRTLTCQGVLLRNTFTLNYDELVIAVGSVAHTYNVPGVATHALFLKELADARAIRQRIIECFEQAAQPGIPVAERDRLLHFVVVGGGPTGIEFAAEMHDFVVDDLARPYRALLPHVRLTLLEAGNAILNTFDATLSAYTARIFRRQHIDIRTETPVVEVSEGSVRLADGSSLPCGLVVWSTGIAPTVFATDLPLPKDRTGRLMTDAMCRVRGQEHIYAVGDCAVSESVDIPATAQVAQQAGVYLGKALSRKAQGRTVGPFVYRHFGMLAYVGGNRALADLGAVKGRGFSTFLFWRSAYLTKLVSLKNKILVIFDWCKTAVFGRDISRF
jgi:NADH:ubiquinone reductase (non-electrogenic)